MTADLMPFTYDGQQVRTVIIDGEPWFLLNDLCSVLRIQNVGNVLARLSDDERSSIRLADGTSGNPTRAIVSEPGMWNVILRSDSPYAEPVRRWVTHEVLPAIRRTGSYSVTPQLQGAELLARAVLEAQAMLAAKDERIAELTPRAEVADRLLDADGDLSVADAAKALTRAGIDTGATRMFKTLAGLRWIYRGQADGRWHVYQSAIETGYMSALPQSHYHPKTGELVMDAPQPRITPKGLQRLMQRLTPARDLQPA